MAAMQLNKMKSLILGLTLLLSFDHYGQLVDGENLIKQKYYDSTLNGIRLRDPRTVEKVFKTTDNLIDPNDDQTEVTNEQGNQLLTMYFLPGDVINQFSQFKVEYNSQNKTTDLKLGEKEFVTGKGIRLGTTEKELIKVLGQPKEKRNESGLTIYLYRQEGEGLYFGNYYFQGGRLIRFWFGEEYP